MCVEIKIIIESTKKTILFKSELAIANSTNILKNILPLTAMKKRQFYSKKFISVPHIHI